MKELNKYPPLNDTTFETKDTPQESDDELMELRDGFVESSNKIYLKTDKEIAKWMTEKYVKLQSGASSKVSSPITSSEPVQMSSQKSFPLHLTQQESLKAIKQFAAAPFTTIDLNDGLPKNVSYVEAKKNNIHYLSMSLKHLITKNDRTKLIQHANMFTQKNKNNILYPMKICYISRTDTDSNKEISKSIYQFLTYVFKDEESHVSDLLKSDQTRVLAIVNMANVTNQEIPKKCFVAAVMYATNQVDSMVLDFIAVAPNLRSNGYGPFLMHFAQVFAKVECDKLSKKSKNDNFYVYLCCRSNIKTLYENMKFQTTKQAAMNKSLKNKLFSNRMNLVELKKKKIALVIMMCNGTIPRVINRLYSQSNFVETSLYVASSSTSVSNTSVCPVQFNQHVDLTLKEYVDENSYKVITPSDINTFRNEDTSQSYLKKHYNEKSFFPLGELFGKSITDWENFTGLSIPKTFCRSIKRIINPCLVQVICKDISNENLDNCSFWVNMKCSHCKKKVSIKKEQTSTFTTFFLKAIYSIWFTHIFGFESVPDSQWHTVNSNWNVCVRRTGSFFNILKDALRQDEAQHTDTQVLHKAHTITKCLMEKFLDIYKERFFLIHQSQLKFMTAIQHEIMGLDSSPKTSKDNTVRTVSDGNNEKATTIVIEKNVQDSSPRKRLRRSCDVTYVDRQKKTLQDIGGVVTVNKKKKNSNKRVGSKRERHDAEREYNELVNMDYEQQLTFQMIEYVNVNQRPSHLSLSKASKDYIAELKIDRKNSVNHKDLHEDNHWLMYPRGKGANPVVVAEEWFIVTNDDDVQIDRQICKATEDDCKQHCNKKYNIKKDFKAKIRKYVETNTKNNQIIRIEKLKKQHILDNDIVMIKYKSYRVVSKIEYKGYNIEKKSHF